MNIRMCLINSENNLLKFFIDYSTTKRLLEEKIIEYFFNKQIDEIYKKYGKIEFWCIDEIMIVKFTNIFLMGQFIENELIPYVISQRLLNIECSMNFYKKSDYEKYVQQK